jgi:hypothetical protein
VNSHFLTFSESINLFSDNIDLYTDY